MRFHALTFRAGHDLDKLVRALASLDQPYDILDALEAIGLGCGGQQQQQQQQEGVTEGNNKKETTTK